MGDTEQEQVSLTYFTFILHNIFLYIHSFERLHTTLDIVILCGQSVYILITNCSNQTQGWTYLDMEFGNIIGFVFKHTNTSSVEMPLFE